MSRYFNYPLLDHEGHWLKKAEKKEKAELWNSAGFLLISRHQSDIKYKFNKSMQNKLQRISDNLEQMLYGKTSYLANPTTSHVVPFMTNITFDATSVVINIIINTICCFSEFFRDDQLILTIFLCFSGAPRLLKILQTTTRSVPKKVYIFREISKIT